MAGKSALPLLALAGIAALALGKKKKKKTAANGKIEFPNWTQVGGGSIPGIEEGPDGSDKMVFDQACSAFAQKINMDKHNTYITGMFHAAVEQGATSAQQIALAMLMDQASQCPWAEPASYTPLMRAVYDQLLAAVAEYARLSGAKIS